MGKHRTEIVLFITLLLFIALSIMFQWNLLLCIDSGVLYILKEKLLILGLSYFAYKNVNNSLMIFTICSVMIYTIIQMIIYIITTLEIVSLIGVVTSIGDTSISMPLCAIGGVILAGMTYLVRK